MTNPETINCRECGLEMVRTVHNRKYHKHCYLAVNARQHQERYERLKGKPKPVPVKRVAVLKKALTGRQFAYLRRLLDGEAAAPGPAGRGDVVRRYRTSGGHY